MIRRVMVEQPKALTYLTDSPLEFEFDADTGILWVTLSASFGYRNPQAAPQASWSKIRQRANPSKHACPKAIVRVAQRKQRPWGNPLAANPVNMVPGAGIEPARPVKDSGF